MDIVELLVPVLQRRGLMWDDYTVPGGTYRENLLATPGHPGVPDGHPAAKFKYDNLKAKYGDESGDITIDLREKVDEPEAEPEKQEEKIVPVMEKTLTNGVNGVKLAINGEQLAAVKAAA